MPLTPEKVLHQLKEIQPTVERIGKWGNGNSRFSSRFTFVQGYLRESIKILEEWVDKERAAGGPLCAVCGKRIVPKHGDVCEPCWDRL